MFRMRNIATSQKGSVFLTTEYAVEKVYCWDIDSYEHISDLDMPPFNSTGGVCFAITDDGTHCIAATYYRYGISMYDIFTGTVIWQRKDIKKAHFLSLDPSNDKVFIGFDGGSMKVVNRHTGEDIEKLRSITGIYFDSALEKRLLLRGRDTLVWDNNKIISPTFAFLDIQATGKGVALTAVGRDLIYYDYNEQKITWRITPKRGEHFIQLAYSGKNDTIYAVLYKYRDQRVEPYHLLYGISAIDGVIKFIFPLPTDSCEYGFAQDSTKLICSNGEIYKLSDSEPVLLHKFNWN